MRTGAAFGVVGLAGLALSWTVPPAAAAGPPPGPEHVITIDPTSGPPGAPVEVSGSCPEGWSALVSLHTVVDPTVRPIQGFGGHLRIDPAADGSYVVTFPIPAEAGAGPWQFSATCSITDIASHYSTADFAVTGGAGFPLTIDWSPQPARTGEGLRVSGGGCVVDGNALRDVSVTVFDATHSERASAEVHTDDQGSWVADLSLPEDMAQPDIRLQAQCETAGHPLTWGRFIEVDLPVVAGGPPPTAVSSTTPPTVLARTGTVSSPTTPLTGALLVITGTVLLVAARRRRATAS